MSKYKHGHTKNKHKDDSPTYRTWSIMKQRCNNPNAVNYKHYGGKGIKVCKRWLQFENFLEDMGERPDGTTIDRIKSDQDYFMDNCRWANKQVQNRSRSGNLNSSSRFKGVHLQKATNKWIAGIRINNKLKALGSYTKEKDAAVAYNKAAFENWGEDAYLNEV